MTARTVVISKRLAKRHYMQWTKRSSHLLLQMRIRKLDGTLHLLASEVQWNSNPG